MACNWHSMTGEGTVGAPTCLNKHIFDMHFSPFYQICSKIKNEGWTEVNDLSNGPYAYMGKQWVGYDTPEFAKVKSDYVVEKGLGGAMIWDLATDDFNVSTG
jgi:GH18 family chitinase